MPHGYAATRPKYRASQLLITNYTLQQLLVLKSVWFHQFISLSSSWHMLGSNEKWMATCHGNYCLGLLPRQILCINLFPSRVAGTCWGQRNQMTIQENMLNTKLEKKKKKKKKRDSISEACFTVLFFVKQSIFSSSFSTQLVTFCNLSLFS